MWDIGGAQSGGLAASSTLQGLLNRQDAALGPWVAARDPLEDALQVSLNLHNCPCTQGILGGACHSWGQHDLAVLMLGLLSRG